MADYTEEKRLVRSFIRKDRRDRLLFELTKAEKRYDGVSRFCHQADDFMDKSKIIMSGTDLNHRPEFLRFVRTRKDEKCYLLSPDYTLDGCTLPLPQAVEQASMNADAVVILGSDFLIVFTEDFKGGSEKYLLCEDRKLC